MMGLYRSVGVMDTTDCWICLLGVQVRSNVVKIDGRQSCDVRLY